MDIRKSIVGKITSVVIMFFYCWMLMCPSIAIAIENEDPVLESGETRSSFVFNSRINPTKEFIDSIYIPSPKRFLHILFTVFCLGNALASNTLETVEKDNFSKVSGLCISTSKVPGVCYQTACWNGTGFIPTETVCPDDQAFCPVPDVRQNVYLSYFSLPS
ncbi:MAG: hypothetical protein K2W94_03925 [Alphaproteobacteria bacterium]|nr:hypothetical protein [Alphaproteobacteria bacterium]